MVATAAPNQVVFRQGEVIAATTVNASTMPDPKLTERILLLIAAAQFRARQAGILDDTVSIAGNQRQAILDFIAQVQQSSDELEIKAIAAEDAYVAGAQLELVAIQDNQLLFKSN